MLTSFERLCYKYKIASVKPLLKGWSGDKKYILENGDEERYVLRLSKSDLYEKKKNQFELLKKIEGGEDEFVNTEGIIARQIADIGNSDKCKGFCFYVYCNTFADSKRARKELDSTKQQISKDNHEL